jgi:TonB family protein
MPFGTPSALSGAWASVLSVYSFLIVSRMQAGCALLAAAIVGQLWAEQKPIRLGPGVTPPRLVRKVEPEYSPLAHADHIQGTVVLQLVVTEKGRAADIQVISPLGYGLDENAISAIQKWEFVPGQKGAVPVPVRATITVNFRFVGTGFDEAGEHRRTEYNVALQSLIRDKGAAKDRAVESILKLARENFPGALYLVGVWETTGENAPAVAQDPAAGWTKIEQAAKKNYGPAIYRVAKRSLDDSPKNEKNWDSVRRAAVLGSREAQYFLGDRYQKGLGVEVNADRAKNYFRLCAAGGVAQCRDRLARLLFDASDRPDYEYEQALTWFSLAADQGIAGDREVVDRETASLTPAQNKTIATLKRQLAGTFEQPQ